MRKIIYVLIIISLSSCSKNDNANNFLDCNELNDQYTVYNGEEIVCHFHYKLTEYNGENYIEFSSPCTDLNRAFVINEDCIDICENDPYDENSDCQKYLMGREIIEILLIEK